MAAATGIDVWTKRRSVPHLGTNKGAQQLAFQSWRRMKEAFAPEVVARAVSESRIPVKTCIDPFGGSGTTALTAQFLGIKPISIEVNPYLADLTRAKLTTYDAEALRRDFLQTLRTVSDDDVDRTLAGLPPTFVEPGRGDRWIFSKNAARRAIGLRNAIDNLPDLANRRLLRVLLGGVLVDVSNVVVSGKGRRYRRNWSVQQKGAADLDAAFLASFNRALSDVVRFADRACLDYEVVTGDSRMELERVEESDLAVFSPPYANSFDYTDVYNVELWMLGYIKDAASNRALRLSTIRSHVQVAWDARVRMANSPLMAQSIGMLTDIKSSLWDERLPEMVDGYFNDLVVILKALREKVDPEGSCWIVVGDSSYGGVTVPTAQILEELAPQSGWTVRYSESSRSLQVSPQQGGLRQLPETLLVLDHSGS